MRRATVLALCLLAVPQAAFAERAPAQDVQHRRPITISQAVRAAGPIRIDGRLDEPDWAAAPVTDSLTQVDPDEGKPASERTEVRVLYDDDALYVGVRLHDSGPIIGRLGRRDMDLGDSDWFGLMIDSYLDHRTAFGFDVNPAGVMRDEIKTIDTDDNSWDAVWDVATTIGDGGWTAEYRVPFSQLRFSHAAEQTWGIQFERVIGRRREYAVSTFTPKSERGGVPEYGHLVGLRDIRPGRRLQLLPYVVGRSEFVDPGPNPFRSNPDHHGTAGGDLNYRVASNLTLNAAINPDFGQVEVDPAVVNLGVYETFFQEKRPFFIEGSEIFDFGSGGTSGGQLFYSRRIGRAPSLGPPTPASDVPDVTTILGAGKLSGKTAGWSIGVLEAVTGREEARYSVAPGDDQRFEVEPLSNYLAARARRELRGGQTLLGGVLTAVDRKLDSDALRAALHASAYAGGVDFRHEWGNRKWVVRGDAEASRVAGSTAAILATQRRSNHYFQRPDADHLEVNPDAKSLTGYSINAALERQAGEHWLGEIAAAATSPEYEVNDIGFSYRTDRRDFESTLTYVENRPGDVLRRWTMSGFGRAERNFDWQSILTYVGVQGSATTLAYWSGNFVVQRYLRALDDRLTRGGPLATRPAWTTYATGLTTDARKPVTANVNGQVQDYESGGWSWTTGVNLGVKASSRWNLTIGPTMTRAFIPAQYVATVPDPAYSATYGARYVFAPLNQTQVGLETRLNVTFTPRLSLETYVQPLLSRGGYGAATQLVAPRTYDFVPYAGAVPNLDFNFRSLRGNSVLRWEWRPGSTLYLAWQQSRSDLAQLGDFDFGRDGRALVDTRPDNIFLVKVSYWLNP